MDGHCSSSVSEDNLYLDTNLKREGTVWPRSFVPSRTEPPKAKVDVTTDAKGKSETQPKGTPDVLGLSLSSQFQWLNSSINPLIYVIGLHLKYTFTIN